MVPVFLSGQPGPLADQLNPDIYLTKLWPSNSRWTRPPPAVVQISLPELPAPSTFYVSGKKLERRAFGSLVTGQRIALKESTKESVSLSKVLAICIAPQMYAEQWASNISLTEAEVLNMPAIDAVPLCYFFLGSGIVTKLLQKAIL